MKQSIERRAAFVAVAGVALALALSACGGGGGGSSGNANVRLVNATSTRASLDLLANGANAVTSIPADSASNYAGVAAGSPTLQVNDTATGTALGTIAPSVGQGLHYALVAYESGGSLRTTVIQEDVAAPAAGTAAVRVIDAATDAGAVDVYVTDPATDITTLSSPSFTFGTSTTLQTSAFLSFTPGTYRVRVTGSGNPSDLRLDLGGVVLASQEVGSLVLTPSIGGTLVNGGLLAEQASYTAGRNPNARVRLAAATTAGATVSASAASAPIASNVGSPSVSGYVLVPATAALNITVNGASVGAPATALVAGSDTTLLVYGSAAAPTASLITDDNHLPTSASNLKLRLFNGLTVGAQALSLDAAFAVVASNVASGTASTYSVVASSTALQLDVFGANSVTPIWSSTSLSTPLSVPGNAVYTLFMLGDAAHPTALLRRDR
ncbi:MAG: DUF4397 domain-containing protein [Rhizobacter sp.]|nr:DUF4397 domain-containing protein [Rhizobacter sp.]